MIRYKFTTELLYIKKTKGQKFKKPVNAETNSTLVQRTLLHDTFE